MIASLRGTLARCEGLSAVVECPGGVGYEVEVPATLLGELRVGSECFLHTVHIVREDAQLLYGFGDLGSANLFRELIRVSGVGPRLGMALLSALPAAELADALRGGRTAALTAVPGVGRKTAERLVMELRDRLAGFDTASAAASLPAPAEAQQALVALGYREGQAAELVRRVQREGMDTQAIVVAALAAVAAGGRG